MRARVEKVDVLGWNKSNIVGFIQLMLMLIIHMLLHLGTVKVMWVLGPLTFPLTNIIVVLMVEILWHLRVVIIYS